MRKKAKILPEETKAFPFAEKQMKRKLFDIIFIDCITI